MALFERLFGTAPRPEDVTPTRVSAAPTIAIASGKGGTGKSFVATSLAVALHQTAHEALLVDCDFGLACAHLLLGSKPTSHLQHLLRRQCKLADVIQRTPAGPDLVPGVTGLRQMAALPDHELRCLGEILDQLARRSDVVLLDTGAGLTPQNVLTLCAADHVLLVTQPEIAALTDAYAVVKTLAQLVDAPRMSVVVNRVTEDGHGEATFAKLSEVSKRHTGLELHWLGSIPEQALVTQRRLGQLPLVATDPQCDVAIAIRAIARRLAAVAGPFERREVPSDSTVGARFEDYRRIV
jgi:flagellar biosynthesis protein FlhG